MTFNLNNMNIHELKKDNHGIVYQYNGKKYFFKKCKSMNNCYNELIAEKIANKMNIPCCHYIFSEKDGFIGVSSEMIDDDNYMSMKEFLKSIYKTVYIKNYRGLDEEDIEYRTKNTLESIWNAIEVKYGHKENGQDIVRKAMETITKIFMFDILIANSDRHTDNLGLIVTDDNIEVAKIYDNEELFSDYAMYNGDYSLYVEDEDVNKSVNSIDKFLKVSAKIYGVELRRYLNIISRESIESMFKELENEDVYINNTIKEHMIGNFELNRKLLNEYLKNYDYKENHKIYYKYNI